MVNFTSPLFLHVLFFMRSMFQLISKWIRRFHFCMLYVHICFIFLLPYFKNNIKRAKNSWTKNWTDTDERQASYNKIHNKNGYKTNWKKTIHIKHVWLGFQRAIFFCKITDAFIITMQCKNLWKIYYKHRCLQKINKNIPHNFT